MKQLNERQYALYNYLLQRGDQWTTQENVAYDLSFYYDYYWCENFHDTNCRQVITNDIRTINNSQEIEKVIISSKKGIKLANEEEFNKHISREYASVFRRLQRVRLKDKKGKAHYSIVFEENGDFDVIESLLKKYDKN